MKFPGWSILVGLIVIVIGGAWVVWDPFGPVEVEPARDTSTPSESATSFTWGAEVVARNLEVPWDLAFLPDGRMLITERPGRVKIMDIDGTITQLAAFENVAAVTESGLLGIAVHPDFPDTNAIYVAYTYRDGVGLVGRVSRLELDGETLINEAPILDNVPAGFIHDAGRIRFGPDKKLWVPTGDAGNGDLAQDPDSLAGKVLRLNPDGSVPEDNPTPGSLVYSLGHRNPQGLDWHPESGALIVAAHGQSAHDEVNLVTAGSNHGWPEYLFCNEEPPAVPPIACSGSDTTWAPSGGAFFDTGPEPFHTSFFLAGLRGQMLRRIEITADGTVGTQENVIAGEYGRLRAVVAGPDGSLYVTTSNRDGRGDPVEQDDRILKLIPQPST